MSATTPGDRRPQRIGELAGAPEIGGVYLVPCCRGNWRGMAGWWPVLGPPHDDADIIGFRPTHYHVDGRFLNAWLWRRYADPSRAVAVTPLCTQVAFPPLVWRRRRCRSTHTGFAAWRTDYAIPWRAPLDAAYAGDRLRRGAHGWVCPHRGAPLNSCPIEPDGTIICPLHGLRWRADDGTAVAGDNDGRLL